MLNYIIKFLFKKKKSYQKLDQLRYLSQSALIEESSSPYMVRSTLLVISLSTLFLIMWAGFTEVDEIAATEGEVIPSKHIQAIQHLEGGIVDTINIVEGELVDEGSVIVVLDGTAIKQDLSALNNKKVSLEYEGQKLRAFINGVVPDFSNIDKGSKDEALEQDQIRSFESMVEARSSERKVIQEQIIQKESALIALVNKRISLEKDIELVKEELNLKKKLYDQGHLNKFKYLQIQKQANQAEGDINKTESEIAQAENAIEEYKNRLDSLEARFLDEAYVELNIVERDIKHIEENITKLQDQVNRLEVKSPSYGYVKVLKIKTIGAVVESGQVIAEIVPLEGNLVLEIRIPPEEVGHIKVGQAVTVKIGSFDFSRYGSVEGKLEYISASSFVDEDGARYYTGRVSLNKKYVGSDPAKNVILPGMTAQADIVTGSKSILSYLLKPIHTSINSAFRER